MQYYDKDASLYGSKSALYCKFDNFVATRSVEGMAISFRKSGVFYIKLCNPFSYDEEFFSSFCAYDEGKYLLYRFHL